MKRIITLFLLVLSFQINNVSAQPSASKKPLRVGVVGLVHTHVHWILGREDRGDIEIVGIVEPNRELAERYSQQHGYSMAIVYPTIEAMVEATQPEAVTAFNTIYDHLSVVHYCAPRGIHVMVEKPLAVSLEHAQQMVALAKKHGIHLLTNYETSWYGSSTESYQKVQKGELGQLKKIEFFTGHPGPKEIGVNDEFLEWLIDPKWNGAGALTDFGCYGANLTTWILDGQAPLSVTCLTQQLKPEIYPLVDDDATILLEYADMQVIIQASWNWTYNRKEMVVYGTDLAINNLNGTDMILTKPDGSKSNQQAPPLPLAVNDPFTLLNEVVRGRVQLNPYDLHNPENNLMVMQILHAAMLSAESGERIEWKKIFGE